MTTGSTSTSDANNLLIPKSPETSFKILSPFVEYIVRGSIKKHDGRQNLFG